MKVLLSFLFLLSVCTSVYADKITVTGRITENGEGVSGVGITEKGTYNSTVTDWDGRYSITVDSDAILEISMIGYLSFEIPVNNRTVINGELQPSNLTLITMPMLFFNMYLPTFH